MAQQTSLPLGNTWGGFRRGAGRKSKSGRSGVPHVRRPSLSRYHPLHVTVRIREGLPSLREQSIFLCIRRQLVKAKARFVRVVHFSVQSNHLHLIVEANDRGNLSRGMKGFGVRVARHLNRLLRSRGKVWEERFHARVLSTPREVRNALVYVLFNHRKHGRPGSIDSRSSAAFLDGWRQDEPMRGRGESPDECPVSPSATWLLGHGWKRLGLLDTHERPSV